MLREIRSDLTSAVARELTKIPLSLISDELLKSAQKKAVYVADPKLGRKMPEPVIRPVDLSTWTVPLS